MIRKLLKCMATIVSAAFVISQIPAVFAVEEQVPALTIQYDASADTFSVSGQLPGAGKKFVTIIIAPQDTAISSADDLENDGVILKTAQADTDGNIDLKIILPDFADKPGRYEYALSVNNVTKTSMFSTVAGNDLLPYLSGLNGGGLSAAKDFVANGAAGLDDGKEKDEDFIASYIYEVKPENGYTAAALMNGYIAGEGLSYVMEGDMTIGEFFAKYYHYLDKNYSHQYEKLPERVQGALNEAYIVGSIAKDFDTTYNNNLFVAQYRTAGNPTELKRVVLEYFEANEISLGEYNKISNNVYKEKVFDELYRYCSQQKTLSDILTSFNKEVEKQLDAAENTKSISEPTGGSHRSSGVTAGSITTEVPATAPSASFSDISEHWAKEYVEEMFKRGIVNGFGDGTFRPDANVTRAEFAKMIVQILDLDAAGDSGFTDVPSESWYSGYIAAVAKAGIVTGSNGKFMPETYITRQDAAVLLARALTYRGKTYLAGSFGFNDEAEISDYAMDSVNGVAGLGLITGYNGYFEPLDNTTRGQAAALLMRVAEYIK
ncbi:MAG: S-layer homology domain-containing protein [Clostridiaceae bacterium]|nr:S-layer homology domain-containing protein [Clostridiaceae bacterium]